MTWVREGVAGDGDVAGRGGRDAKCVVRYCQTHVSGRKCSTMLTRVLFM